MSLRLPPIRALQAFEATARHQSVKKAAAELCLTSSAISKQIQQLEQQLGITLFQRLNRAVRLTEVGERYSTALRRVLGDLADITGQVSARPSARLKVLVPSAFYSQWLLPRLPEFTALRPEVEILLVTYAANSAADSIAAIQSHNADAAVYLGPPQPAQGWDCRPVIRRMYAVPMAAPVLLPDGPLPSLEALAEQTWLHNTALPQAWDLWKAAVGAPDLQPSRTLAFNDGQSMLEAARQGLGVVMGSGPAQAGARTPHGLVPAHAFHVLMGCLTYRFVRASGGRNPALSAFQDWVCGWC